MKRENCVLFHENHGHEDMGGQWLKECTLLLHPSPLALGISHRWLLPQAPVLTLESPHPAQEMDSQNLRRTRG